MIDILNTNSRFVDNSDKILIEVEVDLIKKVMTIKYQGYLIDY